jgi:hypothetical protein
VEQFEHLGLNVDRSGGPGEREPLVIQLELAELEAHLAIVPQRARHGAAGSQGETSVTPDALLQRLPISTISPGRLQGRSAALDQSH